MGNGECQDSEMKPSEMKLWRRIEEHGYRSMERKLKDQTVIPGQINTCFGAPFSFCLHKNLAHWIIISNFSFFSSLLALSAFK